MLYISIFNCISLFQAAGGILCCALALPIWSEFRPLPFAWSPSPCCARVSPMPCGVLITCNELRWSWHWHLKPSIHGCSSLEIQWLRDLCNHVSRRSVCVNPNRQTARTDDWLNDDWISWNMLKVWHLQWIGCWFAHVWRHVEPCLLKLDPLCDAGASTRKFVAYFSGLRKICRCLSKHRGGTTRCTVVATWPQRDFSMTLGTRPGRYSKRQDVTRDVTRCCKMLQDVKILKGLWNTGFEQSRPLAGHVSPDLEKGF